MQINSIGVNYTYRPQNQPQAALSGVSFRGGGVLAKCSAYQKAGSSFRKARADFISKLRAEDAVSRRTVYEIRDIVQDLVAQRCGFPSEKALRHVDIDYEDCRDIFRFGIADSIRSITEQKKGTVLSIPEQLKKLVQDLEVFCKAGVLHKQTSHHYLDGDNAFFTISSRTGEPLVQHITDVAKIRFTMDSAAKFPWDETYNPVIDCNPLINNILPYQRDFINKAVRQYWLQQPFTSVRA